MTTPGARRALQTVAGVLTALLVLDLAAWAGHVRWRDRAMTELATITEQVDLLATRLAEDDAWIERNSRLTQQYAQQHRFAARVEARGRRRTAHDALVDAYNARVMHLYRRFYLAPLPAPAPPLRARWDP
jgi:hypothetical protein